MQASIRSIARAFALTIAGLGVVAPATAAVHPMDPLSADEVRVATEVVRSDARLAAAALPFVAIDEPAKADILAWRPGRPIARRARVLANTPTGVFDVVVDLDRRALLAVVERKGAQGPVTLTETIDVTKIAIGDARFQASLEARGLTDPSKLFCAPWSAGHYGIPAYEGKRILMVGCFDTRRTTNNTFGWPIEKLYAAVDLNARAVLEVFDGGAVPISPSNQNFREADVERLRDARKPTAIAQPEGSSVKLDEHEVKWGNWRFHVRVDPRVGPVISLAQWKDATGYRSVLYQGHLSEMFVPYMDPAVGWYSRTFFDAGEYGAGLLVTRLTSGVDCPASATFQPVVLNNDRGEPLTVSDALCIFERDRGEPIWRHEGDGRRDVELVVRVAATVGNYDYLLDWVFNDAAEIDVRVGATGIIALKGVATQKMSDPTAAEDTRYGTLVAPGLVGTTHDHHFNFRLDLDVDGAANSFRRDTYERMTLSNEPHRRSFYQIRPVVAEHESTAQVDSGHGVQKLMVVNESKTNGVGNPVGYELMYANHGDFLLDPASQPGLRARFLQHDLWVTQYDRAERYAAGDDVFASRETGGLPVWTKKNRPLRRQDVVLWANLSLHHLTRAEDQPVMPTLWHSFKLRPFNFLDRNPALDLRTEPTTPTNARSRQP